MSAPAAALAALAAPRLLTAAPPCLQNWFLMVCAWLIVPRESNKEGGDWCGGGDGEDLDDEDELLMEDDDAGCWGKSSASDSLLRNAYGPPTVHAAHCEDWPGDEHGESWRSNRRQVPANRGVFTCVETGALCSLQWL